MRKPGAKARRRRWRAVKIKSENPFEYARTWFEQEAVRKNRGFNFKGALHRPVNFV